MNWEESLLCRERWCQPINVHGPLLFRCIFPGQCILKLITLTLRAAVCAPKGQIFAQKCPCPKVSPPLHSAEAPNLGMKDRRQ